MTPITHSPLTDKAGREHNEDAVLTLNKDTHHLFVVADGMGGVEGGEVASKITVESLEETFINVDPASVNHERILRGGIMNANQTMVKRAEENPAFEGMGTTVTALLTDGRKATIANIGDSRAYVFRNGILHQITTDHSLIQEYFEAGRLRKEELWNHPKRNIITRSLGATRAVESEIDIYKLDVKAGDLLLLCSDGLTDYVREEKIKQILNSFSFETPEKLCEKLFREAIHNETRDNVSIIIVKV